MDFKIKVLYYTNASNFTRELLITRPTRLLRSGHRCCEALDSKAATGHIRV